MRKLFFLLICLVVVAAACSSEPPSAESVSTASQAIFETPRSGFFNSNVADPFTGRPLCLAYWPGQTPAVSWKDCDLTDPNQDWGVYSFNTPGNFGLWQWIYLKSTGNPGSNPHGTLCVVASSAGNPPVLDTAPCDSHPVNCNGSCFFAGYCYPGTNCPSSAATKVEDFQFWASAGYCPDLTVLTGGSGLRPFGAIPTTTNCGPSTRVGGMIPYGFSTALMLDDSSNGVPYYATQAGGFGGRPWETVEQPSSATVLDHRHQAASAGQIWTFLLDPTNFSQAIHLTAGAAPANGCVNGQCAGTWQGNPGTVLWGSNNSGNPGAGLQWVANGFRAAGVGGTVTDQLGSCAGIGVSGAGNPLIWRNCSSPNGSIHTSAIIR